MATAEKHFKSFGPFEHTHGLYAGEVYIIDAWRPDGSQLFYLPARFEMAMKQHAGKETTFDVSVHRVFRTSDEIAEWLLTLELVVVTALGFPLANKDRSVMRILISLADQMRAMDRAELYRKS